MPHYIAGSGTHGCLYDYCHAHETFEDAVQDLVALHNLGRVRERRLRNDRYLSLKATFAEELSYGADYCEVNTCECIDPERHNDS